MLRCGNRTVAFVVASALGLGCNSQSSATSYPLHAEIPISQLTLAVHGIEVDRPGLVRGGAPEPEDRDYAVRVSCSRWPPIAGTRDRYEYLRGFLERHLTLVDADGDRYPAIGAMSRAWHDLNESSTTVPSFNAADWIVTFRVPEASRDFTLLLRNPDRQQEQPAIASVHLGMP